MPKGDKQPDPSQHTTEASRVYDELMQLPVTKPTDIRVFVDSVRANIESKVLKPSKRDALLRKRWPEFQQERKPDVVSCWIQADKPTTAETKGLTRFAFDLFFDDPVASFTIFFARVSDEWAAMRPLPNAGAGQTRRWENFSRTVIGEFQRLLEQVVKLKKAPAWPTCEVVVEEKVIRFVVDRLAEAIIGLDRLAKPLVRGAKPTQQRSPSTPNDGTSEQGSVERRKYLRAAGGLLGSLRFDDSTGDMSRDRLLGEIDGRVRENSAARGRLQRGRPAARSDSDELRQELAMVREELNRLRAIAEDTQEELGGKVSRLSDELEASQDKVENLSGKLRRADEARDKLSTSLGERTRELETTRKDHHEAIAQARTHGARVKAEELGGLLSADLATIAEIARRDDLNDVCRFLISTVRNIRQQLEAAGVSTGEA